MDTPRTFTLGEAQGLLPILESLLRKAMQDKKTVETIEAEFQQIRNRVQLYGGLRLHIVPLARRHAEFDKAAKEVKDALAEIDSIGAQVKDLDMGLLDFPCVVEGETILLCWKLGEKKITHWHSTEEGFAGRKPIDERIAKAKGRKQ